MGGTRHQQTSTAAVQDIVGGCCKYLMMQIFHLYGLNYLTNPNGTRLKCVFQDVVLSSVSGKCGRPSWFFSVKNVWNYGVNEFSPLKMF